MVDGLATTIIVLALVVAGYAGLTTVLDKPPGRLHVAGLAAVEGLLVVQAVVALGRIFTGDRPEQLATFIGYLLTVVLIPPLAALFGAAERSRWGSAIVAGAGLVVPMMLVRLLQIWPPGG